MPFVLNGHKRSGGNPVGLPRRAAVALHHAVTAFLLLLDGNRIGKYKALGGSSLDDGVALDGIAVLIKLQVAGYQAGNIQRGQSVTQGSAVGGLSLIQGVVDGHVGIVAAGSHGGDLFAVGVIGQAGGIFFQPGLKALGKGIGSGVGVIALNEEGGEVNTVNGSASFRYTLDDGNIVPGIGGQRWPQCPEKPGWPWCRRSRSHRSGS